ncbi:hypothetical protein [Streptomyces sp. NPDC002994]|uniref:hypothetical protein n=1 Tax=Streptomyces sp. NPDC002994 TaxID=3154441 RepID=UPI0033B72788
MGIDLQLHDSRPHWPSRRSKRKPSLIRQSGEHGEALAQLIAKLPANTSGKLWTVDPYKTPSSTSKRPKPHSARSQTSWIAALTTSKPMRSAT